MTAENEKRLAVGYIRVSTDGQVEDGVSLDAQEAKLKAWANLYGYELVRIFRDEGISGRTIRKRPEVQQAISEVARLHCPLVFYSLTRLIRNLKEAIQLLEDIEEAGGSLATVTQSYDTSTVSGWDRYIIDAWLAEREVREISERTRHALQYLKSTGRCAGSVPYGYVVDGTNGDKKLIPNPTEQATIARAVELAQGHTLNEVAEILASEGRLNRMGKPFAASRLSMILKGQREKVGQ